MPHGEQFDVIFCNDVLEHVSDAKRVMQKIFHILRDGGVVAFTIPNRQCISFISKDGHYGKFGMTLLNHYEAKAYAEQNRVIFSCGEFYSLEKYLNIIREFCKDSKVLNVHKACTVQGFPNLAASMHSEYCIFCKSSNCDIYIREKIIKQFADYCTALYADYSKAVENEDYAYFESAYLSKFWTVYGKK